MNGASGSIRIIQFAPDDWRVWVPPTRDEDYESPGDPESALVGPAGDSFWSSFDDAVAFVRDVLASLAVVKDADPAIPGSRVVLTTNNCEVVLAPQGFYVRCGARGCTYVSRWTSSKAVARRWANAHDEDQPDDGRES